VDFRRVAKSPTISLFGLKKPGLLHRDSILAAGHSVEIPAWYLENTYRIHALMRARESSPPPTELLGIVLRFGNIPAMPCV
jgi:hypothetical protein